MGTANLTRLITETAIITLKKPNINYEIINPFNISIDKTHSTEIKEAINLLLINANQAMPDGGKVEINIKYNDIEKTNVNEFYSLEKGNYIIISISDNGIGISEEHLDKVFDPFFTTKQDCVGLGLVIAKFIIQKHSGYIDIESKMNKGTTAHVYIPGSQAGLVF